MFAATRIIATLTYLAAISATLFCAYYPGDLPGRAALIVLLVVRDLLFSAARPTHFHLRYSSQVIQTFALLWYMLSFIPYAREFVLSTCTQMCCKT